MRSHGLDFVIVNDVQQYMDPKLPYGPWIHFATIRRGFDEYIVMHQVPNGLTYIEKVARDQATLYLKVIDDEAERTDIEAFCRAARLLERSNKTEMKLGYWYLQDGATKSLA